ncbi:hypothetical protein DFQ26_006729 [Actinomortierella ambigua]|nr:hypothetical protein DFQ26_006729 [Actinomortierella ambigua]
MYENVIVLRQDPKRRSQYALFPADLIGDLSRQQPSFKKGKARVPEVWKVVVIVNANDYAPSVEGYGLGSLWRILGDMWGSLPKPSAKNLLQHFVHVSLVKNEAANKFKDFEVPELNHAESVLLHLTETHITAQPIE